MLGNAPKSSEILENARECLENSRKFLKMLGKFSEILENSRKSYKFGRIYKEFEEFIRDLKNFQGFSSRAEARGGISAGWSFQILCIFIDFIEFIDF